MRIGALLMPTDDWSSTVETARRIEHLGYDHLWVYDHLSWRHYRDRSWHATYPWIAGLAALTERIRFGTMVSNLNIRHPVTLAKDAMTIDHISAGRLTIGIGAAGTGYDATVLGQEPLTPRQRMDRLEEFTSCFAGLLDGSLRSHTGDWYVIDEARLLPGCVQTPRLPIAIAAGGPRGLDLAARSGDAWITLDDEAEVADQVAIFEARCAAHDRDPTSIDRIYLAGHADLQPLGSLDAFDDVVGRLAELGFTDLVVHLPRADDPWLDHPIEIVEQIATHRLAS
ncbi:MAG: LLM class flavin-dependent oxidoreductase [Actinomycetota bacterium]